MYPQYDWSFHRKIHRGHIRYSNASNRSTHTPRYSFYANFAKLKENYAWSIDNKNSSAKQNECVMKHLLSDTLNCASLFIRLLRLDGRLMKILKLA